MSLSSLIKAYTIIAGGEGSGRKPDIEDKIIKIKEKEWKDQTEEERRTIALHNPTQTKLFGGGPGSGRHKGDIHLGIAPGKTHECQTNSSRIFKRLGYPVVIGRLQEKGSKHSGYNHAWNVTPEGKVYDSTLGSDEAMKHNYIVKKIITDKKIARSGKKIDEAFYAGGPGSGRHSSGISKEEKLEERRRLDQAKREELRKQGKSARGKPIVSDKAKLAMKHMNVATKDIQDKAELAEQAIHSALKGSLKSKDNSPFDVVHNGHGIEVKAIITQKNDKITQKGEAINKKMRFAKANKLKGMHTIAVDFRSKTPTIYHRAGVGSFHLKNMTRVKGGFGGISKHIK